jgi:hypothetical protein
VGLALSQLSARAETHQPHFAPKAKRLILISLPGGISHIDTFDYKPELKNNHGKETQGANTITPFFGKRGSLMKSRSVCAPNGQCQHAAPRGWGGVTFLHGMVSRQCAWSAIFQMSTGFIFRFC